MPRLIYKQAKICCITKKEKKQRKLQGERKRRLKMAASFYALSKKIPPYLNPIGKRMTKIQILKYAIQYIKHLYLFLEESNKKKTMAHYNEYKANDLLKLLYILEEEEAPSKDLFDKKLEIRIITARKLNVGIDDVVKLTKKKKVKEEQRRMERYYYQNGIKLSLDKIQIELNELNMKINK